MKLPIPQRIFFLAFALSLLFFSFWLMFHTFGSGKGKLLISSTVWSDFAAAIPLIRSFSFGSNFPPEYPLFPGEPIRYHFLFFAAVGLLEKIGIPLSLALNIPSALGFFALLIMIYLLGKTIFKKQSVGALAVVLFLFNGSLSFLEFFKKYPLNKETLNQIATNAVFPSFGPYDGKIVSAFWNLNIYTNQRHLAVSYAILILVIYLLLRNLNKPKVLFSILPGILVGILPHLHKVAFGLSVLTLFYFFLAFPKIRKQVAITILTSLLIAIPQLVFLASQTTGIEFFPYYLIGTNLTIASFINYWAHNLGLYIIFIPLGFIFFCNRNQKKLFFLFFIFFVIGHLFKFQPETGANHKFFNVFLIGGNILAGFVLYKIWKSQGILAKTLAVFSFFVLTLSGIIDFFPIKNDVFYSVQDFPESESVTWIVRNTPKNSVFLNSSFLYHPASLSGRKIFLGWPYFSWSSGYDTDKRGKVLKRIFDLRDKEQICFLLKQNKIDYLTAEPADADDIFDVDLAFLKDHFRYSFKDSQKEFFIFETKLNCDSYRLDGSSIIKIQKAKGG